MKREATEKLSQWYNSPTRKPLVLSGARQVGKTWLVQDFASSRGPLAYVNLLNNQTMQSVFVGSLDPDRLLAAISAYTGTTAGDVHTFVFLDEVQECPRALTSLKMFCEQRPDVPCWSQGRYWASRSIEVPTQTVRAGYPGQSEKSIISTSIP